MNQTPSATVRLFPLRETLLLPGTFLPLNVFEPRYRELVSRVMEEDRLIGMNQPLQSDHGTLAVIDPDQPPLYDIGCVGEVVECEPQADGRYLIVLKGLVRFRVLRELPLDEGGYRTVVADTSAFDGDREELAAEIEIGRLLGTAARYCEARELDLDMDLLGALPTAQAVNALCAALPFEAEEKQALLEAAEPRSRRDLLTGLLEMQLETGGEPVPWTPPVVN